jgi:type IV pilus assembly protein PilV
MKVRQQQGFSLLEVMVAVIVFSVGLIGLGLLLTASIRANHVGYLHSQATFAAEAIADNMRANVIGVWQDAYDGNWSAATPAAASDCTATACTPAQLAARDVAAWGQLVGQLLPAGTGTVACTPRAGRPLPNANEILTSPVYSGTCVITMTWSEQTEAADGTVAGTFQWVVTP